MSKNMDQFIRERAEKWLTGDYDEQTKKQVKYLMDNDINELTESFYKDLEFGTGGLRGIMGALPSDTTAATTAVYFRNVSPTSSRPTDSRSTCSIRCVRLLN